PVPPVRKMSQFVGAGSATTLTLADAPAGATAVIMNLTATSTSGVTYISACPTGSALADCIRTSVFNPAPGIDTSHSVMVQPGDPVQQLRHHSPDRRRPGLLHPVSPAAPAVGRRPSARPSMIKAPPAHRRGLVTSAQISPSRGAGMPVRRLRTSAALYRRCPP